MKKYLKADRIVELMKEGWELICSRGLIVGSHIGLHRNGNPCIDVHPKTFKCLSDRKVIRRGGTLKGQAWRTKYILIAP